MSSPWSSSRPETCGRATCESPVATGAAPVRAVRETKSCPGASPRRHAVITGHRQGLSRRWIPAGGRRYSARPVPGPSGGMRNGRPMSTARDIPWRRPQVACGFPMSLVGRPAQVDHSGMLVVRALLLVVVAFLFVMTMSLVFIRDTGLLEKLLLVAAAVLLALLVPRIQRLGRTAPR